MRQPTPPIILRRRIAELVTEQTPMHSGDTVIVGVSGGPDSVALLHILCSSLPQVKFVAVYVDHGLRPEETGAEIELVQGLARRLQAGFAPVSVDVRAAARQEKQSIEESARSLRYRELEAVRKQYRGTAIAVAHTADDQAEELLIRLIRGSGRKGLSGMQFKNGRIIRPLLHEKKETLLHYLHTEKIPFAIDSSNLERTYLRNRVRLDLLPYLHDHFNPSIRQTLLQTARIFEDEEALLEEMADKAWQGAVRVITIAPISPDSPPHTLEIDTKAFSTCHPALQRRILEKCCWQMEERPQFRQIELLLDLVHKGQGGAQIHLSRGLRVHKRGRELIFSYPAGKCSYRGGLSGDGNDEEILP
ncbi:MAG: tRNA lysidine(34) synthetase TilS [Pseudomonadota bacterium]